MGSESKKPVYQVAARSTDGLRIIQLTDSHIFSDVEGKLLGLNTRRSFEAVLNRVAKEELIPDLFLATGDLSQDATIDSYQYLQQKLSKLPAPCLWIPGNHDNPEVMSQYLKGGQLSSYKHLVAEHWQVVMLDSSVKGKVYGHLSELELQRVKKAIKNYPNHHLLVVMHHQPVPVGSVWLDNLGIKNAEDLFAVVADHGQKACFLWGHVHQDFVGEKEGIGLISTPSTCVQFKPASNEFSAGNESPGYRYLTLRNDGQIETVLHRIEDIEFTVDYTIKGY